MAEAFRDRPDFEASPLNNPEKLESHQRPKFRLEPLQEIRKKVAEHSQSTEIGLEKEEQTAVSIEEESEDNLMASANHHIVSKQIKDMSYRRLLKRTRKQLPLGSRLASYVIHQPVVDELSEAVAKSFGRPYGLVGSGFFTVLASMSLYLDGSERSGTKLAIFVSLAIAGYVLGYVSEIMIRLATSKKL